MSRLYEAPVTKLAWFTNVPHVLASTLIVMVHEAVEAFSCAPVTTNFAGPVVTVAVPPQLFDTKTYGAPAPFGNDGITGSTSVKASAPQVAAGVVLVMVIVSVLDQPTGPSMGLEKLLVAFGHGKGICVAGSLQPDVAPLFAIVLEVVEVEVEVVVTQGPTSS